MIVKVLEVFLVDALFVSSDAQRAYVRWVEAGPLSSGFVFLLLFFDWNRCH